MLMVACGGGGTASATPPQPTGPVNIGILAAFSGTNTYGTALLKGAQVAQLYIEQNGGIMGRTIKFIPEDDALDPIDAVTVGRKMLAADNVSLCIGLAVLDWRTVLPILNQAKMVTFTHVTDPALDTKVFPYSFADAPSDALDGTAMVAYAAEQGYKKIALIFDESSNAQSLVPAITAAAKTLKISIVAQPQLPVGVPSYVAAVQELTAAHADAILTQVDPITAGVLFPELRAAGLTSSPIIGSDGTLNPAFVKSVGASTMASINFVAVQSVTSGNTGPGGQLFLAGFQQLFQTKVYRANVLTAYDGVNVAALAMIDAKSTDPAVYVKKILDVTTPGPGVTEVTDFATGAKLLGQGKKIKYLGVGSAMTFNKYHRVTADFEVDKETSSGSVQRMEILTADAILKVISG
jgi:branched-chain amino acid transport system substrate-binding protein